MEIKEINQKEIWEDFLLNCGEKTFLQSWNWGEFQKLMKDKIWRLGILKENSLLGAALIIKITAKRGTFLFLPHSPIMKPEVRSRKYGILKILLEELKQIAKKEKASFIRISPILEKNKENIEIFQELGFREAPIHIHPELTWELDITSSEEDLLKQMRKTTRYLIRQAQKNGEIEISQSKNAEDIEVFNQVYQEVARRHGFTPFSLEYLKNEFLIFSPDGQISLFLGKYKNEIISAAIIVFWQNTAFYHHGASSLKYPNLPVSYLLQWEAIKEAKKRGCALYNFWGIAPSEIKNPHRNPFGILRGKHPWAGLTLFKTGFGGYKKEYAKTQDLPLSSKYWFCYLVEKLRKTKRGL